MVEPIFTSEIFRLFILPFVLVFTLVFAILEKTKLFGEGKRQINAIIGLVVGLILISFSFATKMVSNLMPFLAVSVVILFVFMLLYGFITGKKDGDVLHKGVKIALGIILGFAVITAVLWSAGVLDSVYDIMFNREGASQIWINVLLIGVMAGAIIAVVSSKDKG